VSGPRRAVVADGAPPSALAVARSLVRAGWSVEATRASRGDRAPRSRGVVPLDAPSPSADGEGFVAALVAAAGRGPRATLVPATDAALLAIEARRAAVEAVYDLPLASPDALRRSLDKRATLAAAAGAGVRVPAGMEARGAADADRCGLAPPLVVKPLSSKWRGPGGDVRGAGPAFARDRDGLRAALGALEAAGAPGALVQEWVPGTGVGVGLLRRGGRTVARFVHRRLREVHPAGGPSAAAESAPPDSVVVGPAEALLAALGWEGLAMVEFRRDGDGPPVLMEVNGRPWGTLGLAVDAGVDFPRLWLEGFDGPPPEYAIGIRRSWFAGDVRRVLAARAGPPPGYPGAFPSTRSALADLLLRSSPDLVFRWRDPSPFLGEILGRIA
jgi:predicted ATP-grasp superfamily ATP-dependent carboligase